MRNDIWSDEEFGELRTENEKVKESRIASFAFLSSCLCQKFSFTNPFEKFLLLAGIASAAIAGACLPLVILLFSDLVAIFIRYQLKNEDKSEKNYKNPFEAWANNLRFMFMNDFPMQYDGKNLGDVIEWCAIKTAFLGAIVFVLTFAYAFILNYVAGQQIKRIRLRYFTALINQSTDYKKSYSELFFKAQRNLQYFYTSVGDNFGTLIYSTSTFFSALSISLVSHKDLSGLLMIVFPLMALILFFGSMIYRYFIATEKSHYLIAENLARDIFLNIHAVKAYEGELSELRRYDKLLETSQLAGINTTFLAGVIVGLLYVLLYTSYALTFWQGISMALLPNANGETPNVLIIVNFCMQICYVNFLKIPIFVCFTRKATEAYENIMSQIREEVSESKKKTLEYHIMNGITYNSVSFDYSGSNEKPLLHNVNIHIPSNSLTVLVGPPKSGKTTLLKLLVKLLKPNVGSVQIGKWNVNDLNNSWLRSRIGFVEQNTALFGRTIRETLEMCCGKVDWTENEMINVCRIVNVHSYVTTLPQGYDTLLNSNLPDEVLEKLAIARVLMKNPDVLILDDCMANINPFAQMAFITDFVGTKTVIVVTNNLEIIRASDFIFYFKDGKVETQTYNQLINNSEFASSQKKMVPDFELGGTNIYKCHGDVREKKHLGMDPNEMISNGITISSLPNFNKFLLFKKKEAETRFSEKKINCWKILTLNKKECPYIITAIVAAVILGFSVPAYAMLFGESLGTMILHSQKEVEESLHFIPRMFLVAGLISGIARLVEGYMVAIACSKLTKRLRRSTMDALIQKDIAFFDEDENSLPHLLRLLRVNARLVPFAGSPELVIFVKVLSIIFISAVFALYTSWKLGLIVLGFSPFLFYGLYYLSRFQSSEVDDPKFTESNALVEELFKTRETIQLLNLTDFLMERYKLTLSRTNSPWKEKLAAKSLLFGYSQSMQFFAYAACMFYGGMLVQQNEINFTTFFKIIEALILGTLLVGQVLIIIPSRQTCIKSLVKLMSLDAYCFERSRTLLRSRFEMANWLSTAFIKMKHVGFIHPNQRLVPELRDVNVQVNENQMVVALTGAINSGYSIPLKLLIHFYRYTSGSILVDELDINREFSSKTLRRCTGYVDGRDRFFRRTVARNIAYSAFNTLEGYEAYVGMDEIINAAKEADIHNFISTLSDGYNTILTDEICKNMTPGQVLRLSLARALLRDPKILLIDNIGVEVDEDAQRLMESAVAKACFMRTAVLTSHHLESVAEIADCIYFFKNGSIKEFGKHQKLMEKKGLYFRLFEEQADQMNKIRQRHYFTFQEL